MKGIPTTKTSKKKSYTAQSRGPRARVCYICGREVLISGYEFHTTQCASLFQKREALKPKGEQRKLPENPFNAAPPIADNMSKEMIEEMNALSINAFAETLTSCQWCGRKFLPDKLVIHNRSCTQATPARKVGDPVTTSVVGASKVRTSSSLSAAMNERKQLSVTAPTSSSSLSMSKQTTVRPTSGEIKTKRPNAGAPSNNFIPAEMVQCASCGRTFNEVAYEKHTKICKNVFMKKRKAYNSSEARLSGTDFERPPVHRVAGKKGLVNMSQKDVNRQIHAALTSAAEGRGGIGIGGVNTGSAIKSDWKSKSQDFRRAMRRARQVREAKKEAAEKGVSLSKILDHMPVNADDEAAHEAVYETYVECPTCNRRFNQAAAERHIPKCKFIINKPKKLWSHSGNNATTYKLSSPQDVKARECSWNDNTTPFDYSQQGGINPHFDASNRDELAAYKRNAISKASHASRR